MASWQAKRLLELVGSPESIQRMNHTAAMSSLTKYLLDLEPQAVKHATTHPWLQQAANGQLSNFQLAAWLTQDRLYALMGYTKLMGGLLIKAEAYAVGPAHPKAKKSMKRLEVLGASISNITREISFFEDIARRHGLPLDGTAMRSQGETADRDLLGLLEPTTRGYIDYMVSLSLTGTFEENLVLLWAMEVLYYQAWSFVKANRHINSAGTDNSAAERALDELIPNWTSQGFKDFVDDIANLVDDLGDEWKRPGSDGLAKLEKVWKTVLWYEEHFWNGLSYEEASKKEQTTN